MDNGVSDCWIMGNKLRSAVANASTRNSLQEQLNSIIIEILIVDTDRSNVIILWIVQLAKRLKVGNSDGKS